MQESAEPCVASAQHLMASLAVNDDSSNAGGHWGQLWLQVWKFALLQSIHLAFLGN
jgi:hypothetical protein